MASPLGPVGWAAVGAVGLAAGGLAAFWPRGPGASAAPTAPRASTTASAAAASPCEVPRRSDCTFYASCLEQSVPCGPGGYALGFGDRYCKKFQAARLSPEGTAWTSSVMLCLEQALVPYEGPARKSASCEEIAAAAFGSHPGCYTRPEASICFLPPDDVVAVFDTIGADELFTARTRAQIQAVIETCVLQVADLPDPVGSSRGIPPDDPPISPKDGAAADPPTQKELWAQLREKYRNPPPH